MKVSVYAFHNMRVCMGIALFNRASCGVSLFLHTYTYRLNKTTIGDEGARDIAAGLAYNSTLKTLRRVQYTSCSHKYIIVAVYTKMKISV
jgi:hypothetical protein